ncbi:MAG: hypothetical protein P1U42_02090 [Phycisphaerales bacterium]|nr:hypothetical protein [Phycisphaerales bacterium]
MGLTTERKVFLGLVGVAGLALFIDQGFLGPKEASASSELPSTSSSAIAPIASEPILPTGKPAAEILIDRLRSFGVNDKTQSFDASFSIASMIEQPIVINESNTIETNMNPTSGIAQGSTYVATPTDLPSLSSVMPSPNGGGAVLGGKLVRVGETGPNGYTLVLVHARAVLVEKDGVQFAIEIPMFQDGE